MAKRQHGTLTPNEVETVELDRGYAYVEVLNRNGLGEIWISTDGRDPEPEGDFDVIPAAIGSVQLRSRQSSITSIKLLSDVASKYSVRGA